MATIQLPASGWVERPYQRPLWSYLQSGGKRAIEIAHRRWGKDDLILHHTAIAAHERVASYWHCLPEYAQARKAIWTAINPHTGRRRIDEAFPPELRDTTNEQEMFIRFKVGSTWQVVGSDRYNSLVGAGVAGVAFSEWALANPSAWAYIRPMIEENGGWAAFITTPRGRNHAKAMYDMALRSPGWFAEISTVDDTHSLTPEQLDEARAEYASLFGDDLGNAQFEQEYYCSFNAAIMGAFYARETLAVRSSGRIMEVDADERFPVHVALDIGFRDSTAIWFFQPVPGGKILILDYYVSHHQGAEHYAGIIKDRRSAYGWASGTVFVPHDAKVHEWGSGRTRIEILTELGLKVRVVDQSSDADGHQAVRSTLPMCIFHPRTEQEGFSALESYRREWDDDKKTFKLTALHDWSSHGAKAFQYLAQGWRAQNEAQIPKEKPPVKRPQDYTIDELWAMKPARRRTRV